MLSYQRCKLLQNGFLFLINAAKLIKMLQNYSILVFMFCRITFLVYSQRRKCIRISFFLVSYLRRKMLQNFFSVSHQRRKVLRISFLWFPINAANCCRVAFLISHQRGKLVQNYFFLISYQRRKVHQNYFF